MTQEQEIVRKALVSYFKVKRITQKELAQTIGVNPAQVSKLMCGRCGVTANMATRFNLHYGISVKWMLSGKGSMFDNEEGEKDAVVNALLTLEQKQDELAKLKTKYEVMRNSLLDKYEESGMVTKV